MYSSTIYTIVKMDTNNKRKSGAARMKDTNKKKLFEISSSCKKLQTCFPKTKLKLKKMQ